MKKGILLLMFGVIGMGAMGQIMFQKTYTGIYNEVNSTSVQQTLDGGYIIGGWTDSFALGYGSAAYLIKTDAYGAVIWSKEFTGPEGYQFYCVQQTSDGGYIGIGNDENNDIFLERMSNNGDIIWTKIIEGDYYDYFSGLSIRQTSDSGFVILGEHTYSTYSEMVIEKFDINGNLIWDSGGYYGGYVFYDNTQGYSIEQTMDRGYIITGISDNYGSFLLKYDSTGSFLWSYAYNGNGFNCNFYAAIPTNDGGIAAVGYASNNNPDINLTKTDGNGTVIFSKTYGLSVNGYAYYVKQTSDNGFIIAAYANFGYQSDDFYIFKTDSLGNLIWSKGFGGTRIDVPNTIQQTTDGGYIILGNSTSFTQDSSLVIYLIKTDSNGNSASCYESNPSNAVVSITVDTVSLPFSGSGFGGPASNITINEIDSIGHDSILCTNACDTPAAPGPIYGNTYVCIGSTQTYTIDSVPNVTSYIWSIPNNWTGTSTSTSLTVQVDTPGGNILVYSVNSCSNSTSASVLAVSVAVLPDQPGGIMGTDTICTGSTETYFISPVAGATSYTWTLPSDWTGTSTTTSITITAGNWGVEYITVAADNICGTSPPDSLNVFLYICTGINSIVNNNNAISIYPNPNTGIVTFGQLGIRNYELGIMDVMGRVVYSKMISNSKGSETISLQLSDGIYYWEMRTGDGIAGKGKLVIIRN
jgi:PKD domain-containing protein/type IX secretion system substrate protein